MLGNRPDHGAAVLDGEPSPRTEHRAVRGGGASRAVVGGLQFPNPGRDGEEPAVEGSGEVERRSW
jgi:hypothetical protein